IFFFQRLWSHLGIDTGRTQEHQFSDAAYIRLMDNIVLNGKILVDKISSVRIISDNTAYFCRSKKYILWLLLLKKRSYSSLITEIQFLGSTCYNISKAIRSKLFENSRSNHPSVSGNVYLVFFFHG